MLVIDLVVKWYKIRIFSGDIIHNCLSETDLVRETAKKFGYTRAVGITESVISYTLKKALTAGLIKKSESGNISAK
jgi:hypothetical protein